MVTAFTLVNSPLSTLLDSETYDEPPRAAAARGVIAAVPDGATVETDIAMMSHLVTDHTVYWWGTIGTRVKPEYVLFDAGAGIGWHRDKAVFGEVVGISLLAPCTFRLRRPEGDGWERVALTAEPRSAYLLSGPSRSEWEHSIPPVDALRYSITYRNLRDG